MGPITGSLLYNLVQCPHRVWMDRFEDPTKRDPTSPFVELLWNRGALHEAEIMASVGQPYLDLSLFPKEEREQLTIAAMQRQEPLIFGGRIRADDLLGDPDLLHLQNDGYVAGDIKSGAGEEGGEDHARPKVHYAVQIALYADILERLGLAAGRRPFIWDIHGQEVVYDLEAALGPRNTKTLWATYQESLDLARRIVAQKEKTLPAYAASCKQCHWYSACQTRLKALDDLTLIPELGRSKRDAMVGSIATVQQLSEINPQTFVVGTKTVFPGIGLTTLVKFHERAKLQKQPDARPYLKEPLDLPLADLEIFFDIEVDPLRDFCYLHGFVERHRGDNATERFFGFFADAVSADIERQAFADSWAYLQARPRAVIYYYSKYERMIWRKLQQKHPDVCTADDIEHLFTSPRSIDLYFDTVLKKAEFPTHDYSIKSLAKFLGFRWRDTNPSGAASIEWFDRYLQGDQAMKQRIIDYNADDCIAMRVLLDGLRAL